MPKRHSFGFVLWFATCVVAVASAQSPRSDSPRLQTMVRDASPPGVDVLNLASIDGQVRLLGTAETLAAIHTLLARMRASGLVDEPRVDAVQSPKEGPHVFAISGRDRSVASPVLPTDRYAGSE